MKTIAKITYKSLAFRNMLNNIFSKKLYIVYLKPYAGKAKHLKSELLGKNL